MTRITKENLMMVEEKAMVATEVKAEKKAARASDPWDKKVTIRLPRPVSGEENFVIVSASPNKPVYKIKKGEEVEVPQPVADVIEHMYVAMDRAEDYKRSIIK